MTKKFMQIVARHTELAAKAAKGEASKEELAEMARLNKAIAQVVDKSDEKRTTTLTTMKLSEYREWHEAAVKSIEDGDAEEGLFALVKRNMQSVKGQKKTKADDVVAVEMPVKKTESDRIAELEQRIKQLETGDGSSQPTGDGDGEDAGDGEPDDTNKGDKPTAQAMAIEAIDTLLDKYNKLKEMIDGGNLTKDAMRDIFDGDWQLKDIICDAAAVMAKADELKKALEAVHPELEKLAEKEGEGDAGDDGDGEGDDDNGDPKGTEKGAGDEPKSNWSLGMDIAPRATAEEDVAAIRKSARSRG